MTLTGLESAITLTQPAALQRVIGNIIGNALPTAAVPMCTLR